MDGWIKLHRQFLQWEWWTKDEMVKLYIYILLKANHEENKWQGIEIKRGQMLTGINIINKDTGISIQRIRTCLNRLKSTGEITIKSTNKYSIITICNYDNYQLLNNIANKLINKPTNNQSTNNQHSTNKQITTNKNDKNLNNYKNIINYLNNKCNCNYKYSTKKTQSLINARLKEGFIIDDFKKVIDIKSKQWLKDSEMSKYLRPETLFGTKFEGYLNEKIESPEAQKKRILKDL